MTFAICRIRLSLKLSIISNGDVFSFLAFFPHVNGMLGHWKTQVFKNRPWVEIFEIVGLSPNFTRCNFWSKPCLYLKFLEDVYCSFEHMYSEFQLTGISTSPLFFLAHSVAVAAWRGIQCVDPQMRSILSFFYHLVRRSHFNLQTIFV